ncbi:hypothetical protein RFI_22512 [Reticulomyxa filosa]|uniref:Viral A-type inclusion protein n=1 Tax=Reticulomyxa filosa TaxID=46433 RepID=X6MN59_RETFI|nr:hypothetical protein RFI_22512 [Reticulomyxa filosa]|eukprot:ETO14857.1 hypothetical protein RFI_22512 [Reticulomyxa filosa]
MWKLYLFILSMGAQVTQELKALKERLYQIEKEKQATERQFYENKQQAELKFELEKSGLMANNQKEVDRMNIRINELKTELRQTANSKLNLIQCATNEINRLKFLYTSIYKHNKTKIHFQ